MSDELRKLVIVSTGREFERRKPDGTLMPLTDRAMAKAAFRDSNGTVFVPQQTWEKQFAGQVTAGRIGRPVITYAPLSWLPAERQARIFAALTPTPHPTPADGRTGAK